MAGKSLNKPAQENKSAEGSNIEVGKIEVGGDVDGNVIVGHGNIINRITNFFQGDTKAQLERRNRRVMLDHVEYQWVKGFLEKTLHHEALRAFNIEENPSTLRYPWLIQKGTKHETISPSKSMLDIFQEVGFGRSLLILGKGGSGKTTMLLELASQLIERARKDEIEPIPVVFNLASWKENQTLADWLAEQLNQVYYVPRKTAHAWVKEDRMSLLLDGLDEVGGDRRGKCVDAINEFRKEHGLTALTVCSRIEEYEVLKSKLSLEGAITIQPLTLEQVDEYIGRFGKSLFSVRRLLKKDKALQEFAETPLILSIMALAYKDLNDGELRVLKRIEEQRRHLFNTYINRMFEHSNSSANSAFTKKQTLHYLSWLAGTMIQHNLITYQIESMQPSWLEKEPDIRRYKFYEGLVNGLIGGLIGVFIGGFIGGLIGGLIFGLPSGQGNAIEMMDKLTWSWKDPRREWFAAMLGGLLAGLFVGLFSGLIANQVEETTYPGQRLKQTFITGFTSTCISGLLFGLLFGLLGIPIERLPFGLILGLVIGLVHGFASLIQHYILRRLLERSHSLPRQLMPFLEYAVSLIFLRRVGGSYIFVHRSLMEHFAEMEETPPYPPPRRQASGTIALKGSET